MIEYAMVRRNCRNPARYPAPLATVQTGHSFSTISVEAGVLPRRQKA